MTVLDRDRSELENKKTETNPQHSWVKVYTRDPYSIKILGPFISLNAANRALDEYAAHLEVKGKKCISSFTVFSLSSPSDSEECLTHLQWLQSMMEDYLHFKIP